MKKKVITIVLICAMLLAGSTSSAAAGEIMPRYSKISGVDCTIAADEGSIVFDVYVYVANSSTLDSAYIDLVIKRNDGTVVATYSNKKMTFDIDCFYFADEVDVSTSGTYFFTYEVRCYKNGAVVDNPTGSSSKLIYTA